MKAVATERRRFGYRRIDLVLGRQDIDTFTDGRRFRVLAVVDDCTRECLALVAETSPASGA